MLSPQLVCLHYNNFINNPNSKVQIHKVAYANAGVAALMALVAA